jgi:Ca-activated chloride channel family protein
MNNGTNQAVSGLLDGNGDVIPLEGVEVAGDIVGRGAKVRICQRFRNAGEEPIEAVYKFPLPESAALCGFRAIVDGRVIEAVIEEREKAFDIYDRALSEGDGAQLLDEERPNIFTLSVGNIKPGGVVVMEINYVMLLETHGPEVRFFLPMAVSPRYVPDREPDQDGIPVAELVNPPFALDVPYGMKLDLTIHDRAGIASAGSASHPITTEYRDDKAIISFASETVPMDRDFILTIVHKEPFASRGFVCDVGDARYVQVDFTPEEGDVGDNGCDAGAGKDDAAGRGEMVFVLDCSGSMEGSSMDEAKKALEIMIRALIPGTLFNIYRFGSHFKHLFRRSEVCKEKEIQKALRYLSTCEADLGGTEILAPLMDIYARKLTNARRRDIVLITDGQIGNENEIMELVRKHAAETAVHVAGIGHGPNEFFIRGLARSSGGAAEMIAPGERIEPKILRMFGKIVSGGIRGVTVDWGMDVEQAPLDVVAFVGQTATVFARIPSEKAVNDALRITGETRSGSMAWDIALAPVGGEIPIPLLWARERIREIEEGGGAPAGSRQGERRQAKTRRELLEISRKYGVLCGLTSYVGVEKRSESDRTTSGIVLRKVPVMLTWGWGESSRFPARGRGARRASFSGPCFMRADVAAEHSYSKNQIIDPFESSASFDGIMDRFESANRNQSHVACSVSASFFRRADHAAASAERRDLLLEILACQKTAGGFAPDAFLLREAGLPNVPDTLEISGMEDGADRITLWNTAAILLFLEIRFAKRRDEWEGVVRKSRVWLVKMIAEHRPAIEGQPMEAWLRKHLEKTLGVPAR